MIPVILSGGSGTRLWPVSRQNFPKQFCVFGSQTLFDRCFKRLLPLGQPWVLTAESLKNLSQKALNNLGAPTSTMLIEPEAKNTAPAIAFLLKVLEQKNLTQEIVGIFPADHLIQDEKAFLTCLKQAEMTAREGEIVTLGILPTYPATGYGYIELKNTLSLTETSPQTPQPLQALRFIEKPDLKTAQSFLLDKRYVWNAGMFVFKVSSMIELFKKHLPEIWKTFSELKPDHSNLKEVYSRLKPISIDYGIMEKLSGHISVSCNFGWNDVGSWDALIDSFDSELSPSTKAIEFNSKNNHVFVNDKRTVAFIGVDDLILVETQDATLVAKRGCSESVKNVVESLKKMNDTSVNGHNSEVRPWGQFEVLRDTDRFKSKLITVEPNSQLSYQSHSQRAEHWIIVKGQGEVILNDAAHPLKSGEHIFIPQGAKHRIRNTSSDTILEFVEVQIGSYFGEDDIIRYQDDYQRVLTS